jgi:hypothetical protein
MGWAVLAAVAATVAATLATLYATSTWGTAITWDSMTYLEAARRLAAGEGFAARSLLHPFEPVPVTWWPPGFSFALAIAGGLLGVDPWQAARLLHAVALLASCLLLARLAWVALEEEDERQGSSGASERGSRVDSRRAWVAATVIAFVSYPEVLLVHAYVLSEPLFLVWQLVALLALARFLKSGSASSLALTAAAIGAATLTRYAGAVLVPAAAASVLWARGGSLRRRLSEALTLAVASALPLALWFLRNVTLTGTPDGRIAGRTVGTAELAALRATVIGWFAPAVFPRPIRLALLALVAVAAARLAALVWRSRTQDGNAAGARPVRRALACFAVGYPLFLAASRAARAGGVIPDARTLLPETIVLLLLGVPTLRTWLTRARDLPPRRLVLGTALVLLIARVAAIAPWAAARHADGAMFEGREWATSPVLAAVARLPENARIVTGEPVPVALFTDRVGLMIPEHAGCTEILRQLEAEPIEWRDRPAYLVEFDQAGGVGATADVTTGDRSCLQRVLDTPKGSIWMVAQP